MFDALLRRWHLQVDGAAIHTPGSDLLPVRTADGEAAMLKRARAPEERAGLALMVWWGGDGAAPVIAHEGDALLMARATGPRDLLAMSTGSPAGDDAATDALCDVLARLHAPRAQPAPPLAPLGEWFRALHREAASRGGVYQECAPGRCAARLAAGGHAAARRLSPPQRARFRRRRLAGHRPEGPRRRTRLRPRPDPLQSGPAARGGSGALASATRAGGRARRLRPDAPRAMDGGTRRAVGGLVPGGWRGRQRRPRHRHRPHHARLAAWLTRPHHAERSDINTR